MNSILKRAIERDRVKQKRLKVIGLAIPIVFVLAGASLVFMLWVSHDESSKEQTAKISECVSKGVAWYRDTGSYPTFKTPPNVGRRTQDVVEERCRRSPSAFDFVK